ncbi:MAG: phosphoenolpyruvate carboxylase, partial [Janthinobacterium lividum]
MTSSAPPLSAHSAQPESLTPAADPLSSADDTAITDSSTGSQSTSASADGRALRGRTRADKDRPLFEDIRFLGRLLGDVVREQEGDAVFDVVETIRQHAVKFRRDDDAGAARQLDTLLNGLSRDQTVSVVRAFSYFSHLANIAEDRHHNRRRRIHALAGSAPQPGTVRHALDQLAAHDNAPDALRQFFKHALIMPVLTAHPTEVQRKSILDTQRDIARLLEQRDAPLTAREREDNEASLRACVTSLWQTRMLRESRLSVADEIDNALSYYRTTFFSEIPALYGEIERVLASHGMSMHLPAFFQMGSWIGGDRDGNPNVSAETLEHAVSQQAAVIFEHYLEEVHALGAELSVSELLAGASEALVQLAGVSPDQSDHRVDEPYRRALIGIYVRLGATARTLLGPGAVSLRRAGRGAQPQGVPYESPEAFYGELQVLVDSLQVHHGSSLAVRRLLPLSRAAEVFGFHLASVDLRQSSDVHEAVLAELFAQGGVNADYSALSEAEKTALLLTELAAQRPLFSPWLEYSELARHELAIFGAARDIRQRFGSRAVRNYIISHTETVSDLLEVMLLQKVTGLLRTPAGSVKPQTADDAGATVGGPSTESQPADAGLMVIPLFETIGD